MFDTGFITIIVVIAVIGAIGSIAWWVFLIWAGAKLFSAATRDLDRVFPQVEAALRQYQKMPAGQRPANDPRIAALMMQMNRGLRDIDAVHRARYETRVGEISSMAAQAGIDFTPPSW